MPTITIKLKVADSHSVTDAAARADAAAEAARAPIKGREAGAVVQAVSVTR